MKNKFVPNRPAAKPASTPVTRTPLPLPESSVKRIPSYDEISARAREIWQEQGSPRDRDEAIWLQAERELSGAPRIPSPGADEEEERVFDEDGDPVDKVGERLDEVTRPAPDRSATSL
ncbi:MAG TPA: DUF2934 domain-containing protein [Opitutaceae bacterium]|nr:DUF2934 domain-containing protein [Opitutaceae bacterium]